MNANAYIMTIVIMGIALIIALSVIVFLAILLRDSYSEIRDNYVPVDLPDITWKWKEEDADGSQGKPETEV
jgi:uncharacterized membrane protein